MTPALADSRALALVDCPRWIRTTILGSKDRCPAIGRGGRVPKINGPARVLLVPLSRIQVQISAKVACRRPGDVQPKDAVHHGHAGPDPGNHSAVELPAVALASPTRVGEDRRT